MAEKFQGDPDWLIFGHVSGPEPMTVVRRMGGASSEGPLGGSGQNQPPFCATENAFPVGKGMFYC